VATRSPPSLPPGEFRRPCLPLQEAKQLDLAGGWGVTIPRCVMRKVEYKFYTTFCIIIEAITTSPAASC